MMSSCLYCGVQISSNYELCKEHYFDSREKLIDKCKCGKYKDYEYDLCYECYAKTKNNKSQRKKRVSDDNIKGRLAESIVEEMFIAMDYRVFRFGMENTVPGFGQRYSPRQGPVANHVRKMPDFIIEKDSQLAFIEVKYRTSGDFDFTDYYRSRGKYPWPNVYFVLVTPKYIKVQRSVDLEEGEDFIFLGDHPDFVTDRDIIKQYVEFCRKFFGNC